MRPSRRERRRRTDDRSTTTSPGSSEDNRRDTRRSNKITRERARPLEARRRRTWGPGCRAARRLPAPPRRPGPGRLRKQQAPADAALERPGSRARSAELSAGCGLSPGAPGSRRRACVVGVQKALHGGSDGGGRRLWAQRHGGQRGGEGDQERHIRKVVVAHALDSGDGREATRRGHSLPQDAHLRGRAGGASLAARPAARGAASGNRV